MDWWDASAALGFLAIVFGLTLVYYPLGPIAFGSGLLFVYYLRESSHVPVPSPPEPDDAGESRE